MRLEVVQRLGAGRCARLLLRLHIDWTAGCIGVASDEVEEIWRVVPDGTPIEIRT